MDQLNSYQLSVMRQAELRRERAADRECAGTRLPEPARSWFFGRHRTYQEAQPVPPRPPLVVLSSRAADERWRMAIETICREMDEIEV